MEGQASVEMVALLAGALIVLLGALTVLPEQYAGIAYEGARQGAQAAANRLAGAADEVWLAGDGAQKTLWVELPDGYDAGQTFIGSNEAGGGLSQNRTVGIYISGLGHAFAESHAPLCGMLPNQSGRYLVTVYYNTSGHVMIGGSC